MNLLIMLFSLELGLLSNQPLIMEYDKNYYVTMEVEFIVAELVFVRGNVVTYMDDSTRYGFAPFQADYTIAFGIKTDWIEVGFLHTCSHDIESTAHYNYPVFTGEKLYIKVSGSVTLIGGDNGTNEN